MLVGPFCAANKRTKKNMAKCSQLSMGTEVGERETFSVESLRYIKDVLLMVKLHLKFFFTTTSKVDCIPKRKEPHDFCGAGERWTCCRCLVYKKFYLK